MSLRLIDPSPRALTLRKENPQCQRARDNGEGEVRESIMWNEAGTSR